MIAQNNGEVSEKRFDTVVQMYAYHYNILAYFGDFILLHVAFSQKLVICAYITNYSWKQNNIQQNAPDSIGFNIIFYFLGP